MVERLPYDSYSDINWLSGCLEGRYKGLEKAARIYQASLRQPMYFRLVILELMENLTSGNDEIRKNSLWMLSKLVEEQDNYNFMSPTIQILIHSVQDKNNAVCFYSLKIINAITKSYFEQFKEALPQIVDNLNRGSQKIKLQAAAIVTQYMEADPNAMQSAIKVLVQALKDKDFEIREIAIKALLRIDQQVVQVVASIMEAFDDEIFRERMTKYIFDFIKREPSKVIKALQNSIKNKDEKVRLNSIVFLHQLALTKHGFEIVEAVPELLEAMSDTNKVVRRTAVVILFIVSKIHPQSLQEGIPKFIRFLKVKNKNLLTFICYILVQLIKYFPEELEEHFDSLVKLLEKSQTWEDIAPEYEIVNTITYCTLLRYQNQFAQALNIAQECVNNNKFDKTIYELHLFIGYTHYYLDNYSDAIQAFLKAETAHKVGDFNIATLSNLMIAFNFALLRLFESCLDYKKDAEKYFETAKNHISMRQIEKLQLFLDFINSIANQQFDKAQSTLLSYHALDPVKHPFDQGLHLIDQKNIRKVKRFYIESQEILSELRNQESEDEPSILNNKEP